MSITVALRSIDPSEWGVMREQANVLIKTGFLPESIKTPEQAIAIMMKGRELALPPMYSLSNIVVIKGKPAASAELMLALIYRDHGDDAIRFTTTDATRCTISYKRRSWSTRETYSFTIQDAEAANLLGNNTWKQYRPAMLRARCISAVARMAFPDTIGGLYTPEELGASVSLSEVEESTIHVPPQATDVNHDTGEMAPAPASESAPPAETVVSNGPTPPPSRKVPSLEARYRELLDKADVLGIPGDSYNPRWSVAELTEKGKVLHAKIQDKELAAMGSSR